MALPIHSFWFMNATIDRVKAQEDMRALSVTACSMGGAGAEEHRDRLIMEVGPIVTVTDDSLHYINAQRDEQGFSELKAMALQ